MASGQNVIWLTYNNCTTPGIADSTLPEKDGTGSGYKFITCEPYWGKDDREAVLELNYNLTQTRTMQIVQRGSEIYFDVQNQSFARNVSTTGGTVEFEGECNFDYVSVAVTGVSQSAATVVHGRNDGLTNWSDEGWEEPGHWFGISEPTSVVVTATVTGFNPKEGESGEWETGTITKTYSSGSWSSGSGFDPATAVDADCTDISYRLSVSITTGLLPSTINYGGVLYPNCVLIKVSNFDNDHAAATPITAYCSLKVV